jgi:multicomponent Na+:H+ antiporter subunit G
MTQAQEIIVAISLLLGSFLMVVAGLGLMRLPDVFCRMHAAGKAGTLGIVLVIVGPIVAFAGGDNSVTIPGLLAVFFQFLTSPAATHFLAHACYVTDYPLADVTAMDELEEYIPSQPDATFGHE